MLILLRHGRTLANAERRVQGDLDPPLDAVGVEQARLAGEYIRSRWDIDLVVTTSLQRTTETAVIGGFPASSHVIDDRWREIAFGEFEHRKVAVAAPELSREWARDINYQPVGGESLAALHSRVADASAEWSERSADRHILVVTHATPIKSAVIWATGGGPSMILNLWVNTGSVSVLGRADGTVVLAEFNRGFDEPPT